MVAGYHNNSPLMIPTIDDHRNWQPETNRGAPLSFILIREDYKLAQGSFVL
jgi:hypothetical protein